MNPQGLVAMLATTVLLSGTGCVASRPPQATGGAAAHSIPVAVSSAERRPSDVTLVSFESAEKLAEGDTLVGLESLAIANNPGLRRMQQEAAAAWAKAGYVGKLPDPTISSTFFLPPMNFEPDRQVAELQVMQMLPWFRRLSAETQRAHFEALAAENQYEAERWRILGELRAAWFRLYVLGKQSETLEADRTQLELLVKTASARVSTGASQPGDVLMATLELSNLQEQRLSVRQQVASAQADINRLLGRESQSPLAIPRTLDAKLPPWDHAALRAAALQTQPELRAARLRTAATWWGVEVARLNRRPDVTLSAGWIAMDGTTPESGNDSYTLGVATSLPIWRRKNDAMVSEASQQHYAAHASEEEISQRLDATLQDLWEQARAAQQTVELYESSILPQARQALAADQKSLANNSVAFDRVVRGYRTLLNLELGYHRALGQLASTLARIRQTVGADLPDAPLSPSRQ